MIGIPRPGKTYNTSVLKLLEKNRFVFNEGDNLNRNLENPEKICAVCGSKEKVQFCGKCKFR
jgi:hypothetical protein